jgi:tRNA modification GTPase
MNAAREMDAAPLAMLLTPPGRGAVATISITGRGAVECVANAFFPAGSDPLHQASVGKIVYGRWGSASGEEVVACRVDEETIELHCHGGEAAAARILADLAQHGALVKPWRDLAGDSIRAAAFRALTEATTKPAAAILWDQYSGALERALTDVTTQVRDDHLATAMDAIDRLLSFADLGLHLTTPWRVALVGPPNVGKSSLLNALLGFGRAIVHDLPGTTRDLVTGTTAFAGWPCLLVDTAGLRVTAEPIERAGVALAVAELKHADLLLWIRDATSCSDAEPPLPSYVVREPLVVWNKCDLLDKASQPRGDELLVSALTGHGIETLVAAIAQRLVPETPPRGAAVPFTAAQVARLKNIQADLGFGRASEAIAALESWLGEQTSETLPGEIRE